MVKLLSFTEISPVLVVNMGAFDADEVGEVEVDEDGPLVVAEDVFLGVDLHAAGLVADVDEHGLAHVAVGGDAAGDGDFAAFHVVFTGGVAGFGGGELVFEGVNALFAQGASLALRCSINELVSSIDI